MNSAYIKKHLKINDMTHSSTSYETKIGFNHSYYSFSWSSLRHGTNQYNFGRT